MITFTLYFLLLVIHYYTILIFLRGTKINFCRSSKSRPRQRQLRSQATLRTLVFCNKFKCIHFNWENIAFPFIGSHVVSLQIFQVRWGCREMPVQDCTSLDRHVFDFPSTGVGFPVFLFRSLRCLLQHWRPSLHLWFCLVGLLFLTYAIFFLKQKNMSM